MRKYAKAVGGAITAILVFLIGQVWLELPEEVVASLEVLVTGGVVWALRNRESGPRVPPVAHMESRGR